MNFLQDKHLQNTVVIIALTMTMVVSSVIVLITTPSIVNLVESKITVANATGGNIIPSLIASVAGEEKVASINITSHNVPIPEFTASAVIAQDFDTGQILYQKNTDLKLAPASTTKVMTALVGEEYFQPASELIAYSEALVGGSSMGLSGGERLTYRSLLYGMLLNSGNDAAFVIAANYPGGINAFIQRMNDKSKELGLKNTHFTNPAGFDDPNHYSSAADLAVIAKEAVHDPQLSRIVATRETSIVSLDKTSLHSLKNLNKLLTEDGVIGIKTGFTENAGESFVGLVDRNGHKVITVVLNSKDRFGETKTLMDWVYKNYTWDTVYK